MRLLTALVLILLLSSCQQRYRHVKKVKSEPHLHQEKPQVSEKPFPLSETLDSAAYGKYQSPDVPGSREKAESPFPNKPNSISEETKISKGIQSIKKLLRPLKRDLEKGKNSDDDEPFTFKEKLLVFASFVFWFVLASALVAGLIYLVFLLVFLLPLPSLIIALVTSASVAIAFLYLAFYRQAKKMIEDRVGDKIYGKRLGLYFALAVLVTVAVLLLSYLYLTSIIAIILVAAYFLALSVFLFSYKKV